MTEEEKKAIEILKGFKEGKQERDKLEINNRGGFELGVLYLISIQNAIDIILNLIEKLKKENQELRNTKNNCPQFNTSGIKCKNKDIHCPTSKETLDYYENFLISGYEEEIKKLKKENKELKNKVIKRDNELIDLEETSEKEFLTKQEVKGNYIPKDKIRELLENNYDISTENSRSISVEGAFGFVEDIEELLEEE